jgi:outer membrane protein assembly factor BamB
MSRLTVEFTSRKPMTMKPLALLAALVCFGGLSQSPALAEDWTYWRGPYMNGISYDKNIPDSWKPEGEGSNVLWKLPMGSRSTPIVMKGKLYLITRDKEDKPAEDGEKVVCVDISNGKVIWEQRFNVYLSDVPGERVGWSSVVGDPETGNVYALGVCGLFQCFDGQTGAVKWAHSLHEEYGWLSTYGGRTNFPLVHEERVIISAVVIGSNEIARPTHRFIAFDKRNGQPAWFSGTRPLPEDTTYSAPVLGVINKKLQMVFGSGDGAIWSFEPRTGKPLWNFYCSGHGLNHSPTIVGDKIYFGVGEELLADDGGVSQEIGGLFALDASKAVPPAPGEKAEPPKPPVPGAAPPPPGIDLKKAGGLIWSKKEWGVSRAAPIILGDRMYVPIDSGKIYVVETATGKLIGQQALGRTMRASLLYVDGKIFANELNGNAYVLKPSEKGVEVLQRQRLGGGEEFHGSPICVDGRVYIPSTTALYCIGKPDWKKEDRDTPPALPKEEPRDTDSKVATVQVVPCEALLEPGKDTEQDFQVRLYNSRGQFLRIAKSGEAEFSVKGPGEIDPKTGKYIVPKDSKVAAPVAVTAKVGELTGAARVRVIPDLDWAFNFDDGEVPKTWVAAGFRHVVIDWDLYQKLLKANPMAANLYIYIRSQLINTGAPAITYDDSTPRQSWSELLRFLRLLNADNKPKTKEAASELLDPALKLLQEEKLIGSFEWSTWDRATGEGEAKATEPRLKITKGADYKVTGNGVLCKITTIPKGMRSQSWFGQDTLHDYTIQADVLGAEREGRLPDIGLIAQRYTLDMMGASKQLQIRTWTPQLTRISANIPFTLEPNVWYTMKFRASTGDGKATLEGKIWKKGETEPADWMVKAVDGVPNLQGSPGTFGNAKEAEVFYDNVTVTRNK